MSDLPPQQVNSSPDFFHTGMDYTSPFILYSYFLHRTLLIKSYFCNCICVITKAAHVEVALDLISEALIAECFTAMYRLQRVSQYIKIVWNKQAHNVVDEDTKSILKLFLHFLMKKKWLVSFFYKCVCVYICRMPCHK